LELRKAQARPPGSSFLGAHATTIQAHLGLNERDPTPVIVDSGSDITLISESALQGMSHPPKLKNGQKVRLVQVTGNATINGFVHIDLYFSTDQGTVKMPVEAYVVRGMSAPFILGNDFADQYSISIIHRSIPVQTSITPPFVDENGHAFQVKTGCTDALTPQTRHRRLKHIRQRHRQREQDRTVRSAITTKIPPKTSVRIPVRARFPEGQTEIFVEKI
ncbi:hypothetical protein K474DRAFT_1583976, partial [Panus rudis PR-1116 ss-1]